MNAILNRLPLSIKMALLVSSFILIGQPDAGLGGELRPFPYQGPRGERVYEQYYEQFYQEIRQLNCAELRELINRLSQDHRRARSRREADYFVNLLYRAKRVGREKACY